MLLRADFDPSLRLAQPVIAVAAGTVIGIVIQELTWILLDALTPSIKLYTTLAQTSGSTTLLLALALSWLIGGFCGGLMAGLVGRSRWTAYLCGVLLCGAATLLLWLAWAATPAVWTLGLIPGLGALLGGGLTQRLLHSAHRARPTDDRSR